ncbi:hypothetical protein F5883DRAFT_435749 [Diaporthe sp. PMI_573]|nr:hypothetical protein F5883DRAFT_435749 [Diaporthaceae sp. PMI_573]
MIGDHGEPWGVPQSTSIGLVTTPSSRTCTLRSVRKLSISLRVLMSHPCCRSRRRSRRLSKASKAPCTSIVRMDTTRRMARAHSVSWRKEATRSVAERPGSAPACCGLTIPALTAAHVIRLAMVRSSPLPRQEIRAIGRQERKLERSRLPAFGIMATSARRQGRG